MWRVLLGAALVAFGADASAQDRRPDYGSGQPTRTICSTLIAEAFDRVLYPILPRVELIAGGYWQGEGRGNLSAHHARFHGCD